MTGNYEQARDLVRGVYTQPDHRLAQAQVLATLAVADEQQETNRLLRALLEKEGGRCGLQPAEPIPEVPYTPDCGVLKPHPVHLWAGGECFGVKGGNQE